MPAGTEDYVCVRHTLTEDLYVRAFNAVNPTGTHHTFLSVGPPSGPDGTTACTFSEVHETPIFGSGVGTQEIQLPDGVAMKLNAGDQMLLNLHLFNTSTEEVSGTSGTSIVVANEGEVEFQAQELNIGTLGLEIPPLQVSSKEASCTMTTDSTLFALLPHMHELGAHMKVTVDSAADGQKVVHDAPYDFDEQLYHAIEPVRLAAGDTVTYECTWNNTTERTVAFGDSSLDEMCFVGLYRYPASDPESCVAP